MKEFAVIETGGKQYTVSEGDLITVEKLSETGKGGVVVFDKVLLVDNGKDTTIGTPYIEDASVEGKIEEQGRARKIVVIKYKAKSRYFKKRGHRQPFTKVRISKIK